MRAAPAELQGSDRGFGVGVVGYKKSIAPNLALPKRPAPSSSLAWCRAERACVPNPHSLHVRRGATPPHNHGGLPVSREGAFITGGIGSSMHVRSGSARVDPHSCQLFKSAKGFNPLADLK